MWTNEDNKPFFIERQVRDAVDINFKDLVTVIINPTDRENGTINGYSKPLIKEPPKYYRIIPNDEELGLLICSAYKQYLEALEDFNNLPPSVQERIKKAWN